MEHIIEKIKKSGLRGRGGADFPVYLKWTMVKKAAGERKYIVCNGSEGEPGSFKDGFILENYPGEVIFGIKIALKAVGAADAYVYLRKDYYRKFKNNLEKIISKQPIIIFQKPGGYLCGEETTLFKSIEGQRFEPRIKPPYPPQKGLWNCPTLINNVETFYYVNQIAKGNYRKTRFYSLSGQIKHPGVYEFPEDLDIKQILQKTDNWPSFDFFVQAGGGASGRILTLKELNQSVGGVGAIIVYNTKKTKPIFLMKKWIKFFLNENCGQCLPCREGVYRLNEILNQPKINWQSFEDLLFILERASFCPLGKNIVVPFQGLIKKIIGYDYDDKGNY